MIGSALREDFRQDSGLDLLVKFAPDADCSLMDHVAMEEELAIGPFWFHAIWKSVASISSTSMQMVGWNHTAML